MPLAKPKFLPLAEERRRFQRVKVNLLGRYMLPDKREFPCQVTNMSPGGMALSPPSSPGCRHARGPRRGAWRPFDHPHSQPLNIPGS